MARKKSEGKADDEARKAEEELGEDDRDYEAEVGEPAATPGGGPPRLAPEVAAEVARNIAKEGEGKEAAGAAVEAAEPAEGDMPTLARDDAAVRTAREKAGGDPAKQSQVPGQPAVEDPKRAPTSTESALNQESIARKGDSAPMHPSQNAGVGNEPITLQVEATKPDEERRFRVVSGMVGGFRVGPNGEPSGWVGLKQMNITAEMVPRLIEKGVIEEQQ